MDRSGFSSTGRSDRPYRVLVVEDDGPHLSLQVDILQTLPSQVTTADSGLKALGLVKNGNFDLVLLNKRLPDIDGDEVCYRIRQELNNQLLPVIMVTGSGSSQSLHHSLSIGANDFIKKPYDPLELKSRARAAIEMKHLMDQLDDAASVLFTLAKMVEARDPTTGEHCNRLVNTCRILGETLNLSASDQEALRKGAILHDIGKIGVPDTVLLKPGELTSDEWQVMQRHAAIGADLCQQLNSVRDAVPIIRHHHERWDGSGYPDGLSGEGIPLVARVFQYADIYDALRHDRVYSKAQPVDKILEVLKLEIENGWRDPEIGRVFIDILLQDSSRFDDR
ncbi:response regulator [Candidatus Thiodiazotropha sp. CDECU1]|uniref:response regulator n=1 Tax=Candidatus Thiodiazotropha sp. CDECU1 TaxID=3065865 RepID=UPI00292CA72F|nr:HD domain-containing phosphohydrolase [Candidatus Thiodiazotropha sp. CDECU1]